jgi:hypothetical protein
MKVWLRSGIRSVAALAIVAVGISSPKPILAARQAADPNASPSNQPEAKDNKERSSADAPTTKLRILVTGTSDKPIGNASVYVRYNTAGGFLHHDKLAEMDLKTNQDGSVKVPAIPQGKVMIQVIAPGWHTFGKWYDIDKAEEIISIKLDAPPHWY